MEERKGWKEGERKGIGKVRRGGEIMMGGGRGRKGGRGKEWRKSFTSSRGYEEKTRWGEAERVYSSS